MVTLNPDQLKIWQEQNLEHLRYEYPDVKPGEYCIDIGSYQREWANEMIKRYGVEVECFEALDNRAAWIKDGKLKFGGQYYYTSIAEPGNTWYDAVDIAPFLQREVAVLKMNIEGAEYILLQYIIAKGLHKNIRNLQVQFHYIEGQNCEQLYNIIAAALSETHELTWRYPFVWENWKRKDMNAEEKKPLKGGIVSDTERLTNHKEGEEIYVPKEKLMPEPENPEEGLKDKLNVETKE